MTLTVASWNVNSIKARLPNVLDWLKEAAPDVVCLQEIKTVDEGFPREEIEGSKEAARRAEPDARESSPRNTQTLAEKGDYIIQIGSYRSRGDAESQRAELALIGVEARVETVTINESETWYRVRVGPIADAPRVHSLMMRLEEHGMRDAMLVRVKK